MTPEKLADIASSCREFDVLGGCCLHLAVCDGNVDAASIAFCLGRAQAAAATGRGPETDSQGIPFDHDLCVELATELAALSEYDRVIACGFAGDLVFVGHEHVDYEGDEVVAVIRVCDLSFATMREVESYVHDATRINGGGPRPAIDSLHVNAWRHGRHVPGSGRTAEPTYSTDDQVTKWRTPLVWNR